MLGAALELGREADTERQTARATADTADDVSTPQVDERREGLNDARTHVSHAGADQASATALLGQAEANRATATVRAPATSTAAQSYPTPIKERDRRAGGAQGRPGLRRPRGDPQGTNGRPAALTAGRPMTTTERAGRGPRALLAALTAVTVSYTDWP